jgi:hypothetical protein
MAIDYIIDSNAHDIPASHAGGTISEYAVDQRIVWIRSLMGCLS